ncbi:uncharacterized protein LOC127870374 [Dreissena polymorpha]|uniref:Uncharacterized protein n=1 Tax=Dreissena polymorpha TaxID=45954 RepID=A0A9D4M4I5_DREPO|nr:uncharacterized protein LOC127870374 [Dreissena polymorpha]KAH3870083.1 hypothetical protein DPMN_033263 [Dreissena polymorpha]
MKCKRKTIPNVWILCLVYGLFKSTCVLGACAPNDVKNDLIKCLAYQKIGTYYQFPIVESTNYYKGFCGNSTCMTYCMKSVASACSSQEFMVVNGDGSNLVGAYLGLCNETETAVGEFISCSNTVSNQAALDVISPFENKLQASYLASTENTTEICEDWNAMMVNLTTLITTACSGNALELWKTFLNTVSYNCDNTKTPSWYATSASFDVSICVISGAVTSAHFALLLTMFLPMVIVLCLFFGWDL